MRHTGNNLAAATAASTRDLMHRMGHASMWAALIYQHANSERDREIAAAVDRPIIKQAKRAAAKGKQKPAKGKPTMAAEDAGDGGAGRGGGRTDPARRGRRTSRPSGSRPRVGRPRGRHAKRPRTVRRALLARKWHPGSKKAETRTAQARRSCR
ncbi:hypothetical protein GCM10029963_62100 [Micromonospora andamanensis]|nr:hypothetical protein Vwe01_49400 [Micromonospora andamanensis]